MSQVKYVNHLMNDIGRILSICATATYYCVLRRLSRRADTIYRQDDRGILLY